MSTAVQNIKNLIDSNQKRETDFKNFVLQGGAGSGKTETLKDIISYISEKYPGKTIACITHTNVAADEIKSRVGDQYEISTIHSFLNNLIKKYKKNLKEILPDIFLIENIQEESHDSYKKSHTKYSSKLYAVKKESTEKVIGKREYDKAPANFNFDLNEKIKQLNLEIKQIIRDKDFEFIEYNETRFDSFEQLTFSHDSLLVLAHNLAQKFDLLPQIISDKFDFIFIDEYQDTSKHIIDLFLNLLPANKKTTIGLFGDSMQGIYDDGVGDVKNRLDEGVLMKIDKEDNFRCSAEVIKFINTIRHDDIQQELALKEGEKSEDRKGSVHLIYSIVENKPHARSTSEDKETYANKLKELVTFAKTINSEDKVKFLVLTNKSISGEVGFPMLYRVFDERFNDVKEEIEKELAKTQIAEIAELCKLYKTKTYNELILRIKKNGFQIKTINDKHLISNFFNELITGDYSLMAAINYSIDKKIIKRSERSQQYFYSKDKFLEELISDRRFNELEGFYLAGSNTIKRLKDNHQLELQEEEFNEFEKNFKKKRFYTYLFSDELKFQEVINYQSYLNEETEYITMHKTKGSGIENVIVVLDEYFWSKYNFRSIYDPEVEITKKNFNQKLFYVACSRAIKKLTVVRLIEREEEEIIKSFFTNCEIIEK
jgi:DNA helicase-2/ATP-dependent DNA helicase PcrA